MRLLAGHGCDINNAEVQAVTPAFFAAQGGHIECLSLLLESGADGSAARADGASPLIIASQNGHCSCIRVLLNHLMSNELSSRSAMQGSKGAKESTQRSKGARSRPKMTDNDVDGVGAVSAPSSPRTCLEHRTSSGYTALCMAVVAGRQRCVRELLSAGADVDAIDRKGRSPLYLAAAAGDSTMCGLLLTHGAHPRRKATDSIEPIVAAVERGYPSAAWRIVKNARLDSEAILTSAGVPITKYLKDFIRRAKGTAQDGRSDHKRKGEENEGGTRNGGGYGRNKCLAALLPSSVVRLPPAMTCVTAQGRGCTLSDGSNASSGTTVSGDDGGSRKQADVAPITTGSTASRNDLTSTTTVFVEDRRRGSDVLPIASTSVAHDGEHRRHRYMTSTYQTKDGNTSPPPPPPRAPRSHAESRWTSIKIPTRVHGGPSVPVPSAAVDRGTPRAPVLHSPWSGVHGGEEHGIAPGSATPGRRKPVRAAKHGCDLWSTAGDAVSKEPTLLWVQQRRRYRQQTQQVYASGVKEGDRQQQLHHRPPHDVLHHMEKPIQRQRQWHRGEPPSQPHDRPPSEAQPQSQSWQQQPQEHTTLLKRMAAFLFDVESE